MSAINYEMLRGLAYRSIKHIDMPLYTRKIPALFGIITGGIFISMPSQPMLLGKDGLLVMVLSVLATLPGFYFAGLAAVATFSAPAMDTPMPTPAPTLKVFVTGHWHSIELSRRQFLSYLFSYLVFISFLLCLIILAINASAPLMMELKAISVDSKLEWLWLTVRGFSIVLFAMMIGSMIATTLQGMFFLSERIHQP